MNNHSFTRWIFKLLTKKKIISIGTNYHPSTPMEVEYVEMFNFTNTMLMEIEEAQISSDSIFYNLLRDLGSENIPKNHKFYEIVEAEKKVEEYALVSNIIMGSDRYLYVELLNPSPIIEQFSKFILEENGEIIEQSSTEIVSKMLSKNDAIRVAIKLVGLGLDNNIKVRSAVGMTGAASIERSIKLNREIGDFPGVGFTKLGGEYAIILDTKFSSPKTNINDNHNYLFIDIMDSTKFTNDYGKDKLVELMNSVKIFIEEECKGKIEGYRHGGDDLIARFPSKDLAIRAGLDSAWFTLNNGAKIRAGIGKTRREAGERAQMADEIQIFNPLSLVVFELANGLYGYYVPSEFIRTILSFIFTKKSKIFGVFIFVFVVSYILALLGIGEFGFLAVIIAIFYAILS
ncbi:hypothetical protein [Methanobrevibacter curvatus]|uniref:Uncharacterized protein n=1 Tax=Methanobrevibacter curvatus TaxID=49547 RepID=A0A166C1G4_9EURY|nr:hypothetical protein [Methanobrevibacter curvatus]KZX10587.1 hypothetical protein MBCUR_17440 [Methanobrevibacter curvatus]